MVGKLVLIIGITALCMISPRPDMLLVISNSLRGDRRAGLWTSLGVLTGNLVHITYCLLGLGVLIASSIAVYATRELVGAAYLVYLGVRSLWGAGKSEPAHAPVLRARRAGRSAYVQGLLTTSALFWVSLVQTLHVPQLRNALAGSRKLVDRVFGAVLIALGLRVAIDR